MREMIDFFYDEASLCREKNEYAKAQSIETAGSMINNTFHGKEVNQWLPVVRNSIMSSISSLISNKRRDSMYQEEIEGYQYALDMLDLIADEYNVVL